MPFNNFQVSNQCNYFSALSSLSKNVAFPPGGFFRTNDIHTIHRFFNIHYEISEITEQEGDANEVEAAAAAAAAAATSAASLRYGDVWNTSPAPLWNPAAAGCTSSALLAALHLACSSCCQFNQVNSIRFNWLDQLTGDVQRTRSWAADGRTIPAGNAEGK